ncbi:hypothetical protein BH11PSE4_BH11PSE4_42580 [soil metagenome]
MANFEITTPAEPRFDGDFKLAAKAGHAPIDPERDYLAAVDALLDHLAADEAADIAAHYPKPPLRTRQTARKLAASTLRANAGKFVEGFNTTGDVTEVTAIGDNYRSGLPQFGAADRDAARFDGDFEIVRIAGYHPDAGELAYFDSVKRALDEFAADKRLDSISGFTQNVIDAREIQRKSSADALRGQVDGYWTGLRSAPDAAEQAMLLRGRYQARRDRLTKLLFNVKLLPEADKVADADCERSLEINLFGGLPAPQDIPSASKQELYVQIHKTNTVIRTVCERMRDRSESGWRSAIFGPNEMMRKRSRILANEFLSKLSGIAVIGLELEFTELAKLTLAELRNEFFTLEAGRIKNMYVRRLGFWAAAAALAFVLVYIGFYTGRLTAPWGNEHRSFLLAGCGAAIGTWASFSVRRDQFSFDDLVMVEEDSLDPPMRILFVIVLTMAACLLFWNNAVNLEIGNLKTEPERFKLAGSVALLIGLFCGLSERALATAIAGRAQALVKGVAG